MRDWSRQDVLAIAGLLVAVIACLASVMLPETRALLGLSTGADPATPPGQTAQPSNPAQPVQPSPAPTPTAEPAVTASTAVSPAGPASPASSPPLQVSETAAEEEGTPEAPPNAVMDNPPSEELSPELEARLRNERSGRDQRNVEAFQYEDAMRREAEERARREKPARDQRLREALQYEQEMREKAEARSRGAQSPELRTTTKGLVRFQVEPADASLYLDGRLIGTAQDLAEGIRIEAGDHRLMIMSPGRKSYEGTFTVIGGKSLDVEVELKSLE